MTFKLFKTILLSLLVIAVALFSTAIAYASDSDLLSDNISDINSDDITSSSVEQELLAPDLRNPVYLQVAKDLKASTASTYDIDDIYYIVQECANALVEFDGTEYVSVTEYVHACLSGLANGLFNGSSSNPYLRTINSNIASIQAAVYGPAWDGSGVTNSLWNALQTLYSVNHADQLAQMAKEQGIIDALVGNTQYSISYKLDDLSSSLNSIQWNNISLSNIIVYDKNNNVVTTNSTLPAGIGRFSFMFTPQTNNCVFLFQIPLRIANGSDNIKDITFHTSQFQFYPNYSYFFKNNYLYLYFDNIPYYATTWRYYISINTDSQLYYAGSTPYAYYIESSSQDYYTVLKSILADTQVRLQSHIDNDIHTMSGGVDKLVQMYASDDLIAAKQAQQNYEDQAISDFTGSGSAAAGGSDLSGAKQVSGSLKNGLSTGVSVSDGLSIFNSGSFWGWFTQSNSDQINNLYVPSRGSESFDYYDPYIYDKNLNDIFSHMQGDIK